MKPAHDSILRIGSQDLIPIGDSYRFVIKETLPHKGYKFKFGIRDRVLREVLSRGKRLSVAFSERPGVEITHNPIKWMSLGEPKSEVKLFKNNPMKMWYFFVNFRNEVEKREKGGQINLI